MKRAIREHATDFTAIVALIAIAAGISYYILQQQRMRIPILEAKPFILKGEFETGQAVTPGQGQTVRISGVRIGDIAKVELVNSRAIITMEIDRKYDEIVRQNWTGLLRPKTGLKDMFIELMPGRGNAPLAREGWTMPVSNTLPDINPDEFLASLDVDTRDYLKLLLNGARHGLTNRAGDLNAVLKRFEPTYRDLGAVQHEVAKRRQDLHRLINVLDELYTDLGKRDDDLAQLVSSSARTFDAFAKERENVSATIRELPRTLEVTEDALERVGSMAQVLRPAADEIRPAIRALRRANAATLPFAKEAMPQLRDDIRPFVREARPLIRELDPTTHDLVEGEPGLKRSVKVLNHLFNLAAFNKDGREGPEKEGRDEGYLFYLAWLAHQSVNIFSGTDANGVFRPLVLGGTCNTIRNTVQSVPGGEFIAGATSIFYDAGICGGVLGKRDAKKGSR